MGNELPGVPLITLDLPVDGGGTTKSTGTLYGPYLAIMRGDSDIRKNPYAARYIAQELGDELEHLDYELHHRRVTAACQRADSSCGPGNPPTPGYPREDSN